MTAPAVERPFPGLRTGHVFGPADPRTMRFASFANLRAIAAPARVDWMGKVRSWPMLANDRIGCCEVVTCAHSVQAWTAYAGRETVLTDVDVIRAYSNITGYNPSTGRPDPGITSLDMLNYWRRIGVGGHRILAYVQVDVHNRDEVKAALAAAGALLIGADLPLAAGDQLGAGKGWTLQRGPRGRVGSWGGHAMHVGGYDGRGVDLSTWARRQRATWAWWESYVMEAYAPISRDWLTVAGISPAGLDINALATELHRITGV